MEMEDHSVSKKEFKQNLLKKMQTKSFLTDTDNLLRPTITYDQQEAFLLIDEHLLKLL
jgi:transcriptional regulator of NAD metabolism